MENFEIESRQDKLEEYESRKKVCLVFPQKIALVLNTLIFISTIETCNLSFQNLFSLLYL